MINNQRTTRFAPIAGRCSAAHNREGTRSMTSQGQQQEATTAEAEEILRQAAQKLGDFPREVSEALGVNADGTPAEGGLTVQALRLAATIKKYADLVAQIMDLFDRADPDALKAVFGKIGEDKAEAPHRRVHHVPGPLGRTPRFPVAAVIEALDLKGPVRAALRSAAQSLASALNDGEVDDEGVFGAAADEVIKNLPDRGKRAVRTGLCNDLSIECDNGHKTLLSMLGKEPFLLIRLKMDKATQEGVQVDGQAEILVGGLGNGMDAAGLLNMSYEAYMECERQGEVLGRDMDGVVIGYQQVSASAAGPSTEAPYGVPDRNTPRENSPEPVPAGDDEGSDGPGSASDAPDRESPAGDAAPVNDR